MLHYLRYIEPPIAPSSASSSILGPQSSPLATIQSAAVAEPEVNQTPRETTLLLGGYSYGSMIATSVPSIESIMSRFEQAAKGSNEEEIHLRAARLCRQWNAEARERQRGRPLTAAESGPRSSSSVLCGGEESEPGTRRLSRDSRRSIDVVRRSVDRTRRKMSRKSQRSDESLHKQELQSTPHTTPRICYLLVSPLLPPVSSFLTVFANSHLFGRHATPTLDTSKLSRHPTLAVWGDGDFFTSSKKLSRWAGGLSGASASLFEYVQIEDAGHFWHEVGVEPQLKNAIKRWLTALER
jgi:pimeloyl-ACP methyl ester carboxylesterase